MNKNIVLIFLISITLFSGFVQLSRKEYKLYMLKDYISEEQEYKADFNKEGIAFFHSTFYRNTTYRIIAYQDLSDVVKFSISDCQGNLIFSNDAHNYAPYWDFHFENTVSCIITVKSLTNDEINNSGTAVLMIGFKK